ncbi:MAG TPA: shikimate dehydrogenase [Solirubrobacteraceae bacterium]|nr:shikimate dehydrogenase [Solirubrobacteraceae bacterium]
MPPPAPAAAAAERTRLGVLGWPVAHSRSPAMMGAAFAALAMDGWRYQRLPVPPHLFDETVRALAGGGLLGANVTIPHKQAALALATDATPTARAIGAANTLTFRADGAIEAENTDAPGLIAAIERGGLASPAGRSALVLGAGGSARAAVWALREAGAAEVAVWNRTPARARELARELDVRFVASPEPAELLVNCTSVGLGTENLIEQSSGEQTVLSQLGLTFDGIGEYSHVIDLVYRTEPTPLLAAAEAQGAGTVDGLEILLAQGALSFELWTGRAAPLAAMRAAVREAGA